MGMTLALTTESPVQLGGFGFADLVARRQQSLDEQWTTERITEVATQLAAMTSPRIC
jgi:hypothetical protein